MTDWVQTLLGMKYAPDQPREPSGSSEGGQWAPASVAKRPATVNPKRVYGKERRYTMRRIRDGEIQASFEDPRSRYKNELRIDLMNRDSIALAAPGRGGNFSLSYNWVASNIPLDATRGAIKKHLQERALYGGIIGNYFDRRTGHGLNDVVDAVVRARKVFVQEMEQ